MRLALVPTFAESNLGSHQTDNAQHKNRACPIYTIKSVNSITPPSTPDNCEPDSQLIGYKIHQK